ncbi:MAG: helicase-related protein [Polaromonas sp.]
MTEKNLFSPHGIKDNHTRGKVADFLGSRLAKGSRLSVVSAYFTIYAYDALRQELDDIESLQFLFGEPRFIQSLDPAKTDKKAFNIEDEGLKLSNRLQQKEVARRCAEWISSKVEIRSIRETNLLHGKLYHIHDGQREHALMGSSNFTMRGLGLSATPNIELNMVVDSDRDRADLKVWFDELWRDTTLVEDVKGQVLDYLAQLYVDHSPEFIYFKTLFHVFEKYLSGQQEQEQFFNNTTITTTGIWKALFEFQKDGAKAAIQKINTHNGCILADSVGLGKTYSALAVIKYHELRNHRVLVLCPKKLRDNWTVYLSNSELNPFLEDKFSYHVLSHTDLSRETGTVGIHDLSQLNWGNYDLVVIDESHNFRNNVKGKRDTDGKVIKKSRYERLLQDIIQKGVKTKVMLLSATPVNNDLKDLRNQLYLVSEGKDHAFMQSTGIASIKHTLDAAQKTFGEWAKHTSERNPKDLMDRLPAGFFTLLDELTIARSRKHIQKYYRASMAEIGQFPKRAKPMSVYSDIDQKGRFPSYDKLNEEIDKYQLSLFKPSTYVLDQFKSHYQDKVDVRNFSQEKREKFLIGMMKVNFLKRLESSVKSFAITMNRTVEKIEDLEERLNGYKLLRDGKAEDLQATLFLMEAEEDEELREAFEVGSLKYRMEHMDVDRWLADLAADKRQLSMLAESAGGVTPERDAKLATLKTIIDKQVTQPGINQRGETNRKVIVFCAFADTAAYLYEQLENWAAQTLKVHIALVSGGTRPNRSTFGAADFNQILTNFAPRAKQRHKMPQMPQMPQMPKDGEIDILIATDCISEGQNLQDCALLINYDIHWNPVRIIQRFGRIDRIGSLNDSIQLVNFWPTPDLNKYINLKNRVEARMALVDIAATNEDNVLSHSELEELIHQDLKYRDKQLMRLKDEVLDLEDFNESVALNEFTLDDFRMDLSNYLQANHTRLEEAPYGLYGVVPASAEQAGIKPGVIYCLRQRHPPAQGHETVNPLSPYFLVYIQADGAVRYNFSAPKQVLDIFRALCQGKSEPYAQLCQLFDTETQHGQDMSAYSALLYKTVAAIVAQFSRKNAANLFTGRGGKLMDATQAVKNNNDFELITWLVIK